MKKSLYLQLFLYFLLGMIWPHFANTQVVFTAAEQAYTGEISTKSFYPKFFSDANGDYRDDILNLHRGEYLHVLSYCQANTQLYNRKSAQLSDSKEWTTGIIDINNDGNGELYSSGFYSRTKVYSATSDSFDFEQTALLNTSIFAQGSSVVDINNDGYADLFVCHDDAESHVFMNDGQGSLVRDQDIMDMETVPASDNSGNYGVVWFDIDLDNDMDCFIAKCRGGIIDPEDPRRINALFINYGNHQFTDLADSFNLNDGSQSWAADFADFDNDGDFDIYVANHEAPHKLMINNNNEYFESVAIKNADGEDIFAASYHSICADFDNDGWIDILIAGAGRDAIMWNKGQLDFEYEEKPFVDNAVAAGIGDINQDGFVDVSVSFQNSSLNSDKVDRIYLNEANDNHYIKLSFQGTSSNRQGIGALVQCYSQNGAQINQTRAGTSYSAFNSLNLTFGVGEDTVIDSLFITWPSGIVDKYVDLEVNKHYLAIEDELINELPEIVAEKLSICEGESLELVASQMIQWNAGTMDSNLVITEPGVYFGNAMLGGFEFPTNKLIITRNPAQYNNITLNTVQDLEFCDGDAFRLKSLEDELLTWSDGTVSDAIEIQNTGVYYGFIDGDCGLIYSDSIQVNVASVEGQNVEQIINEYTSYELDIEKENTIWYADITGVDSLTEGASLTVDLVSDSSFYFKHFYHPSNATSFVGPSFEQAEIDPSYPEFFNIGLLLFANEDKRLHSFKTQAQESGNRTFLLMNVIGDTIEQKSIYFEEGETKEIVLDWILRQGMQYTLTTDKALNINEFGTESPLLIALDSPLEYPFTQEDVSFQGLTVSDQFPYFFDLQMAYYFDSCESDLYEYKLRLSSANTKTARPATFDIYPNPGSDILHVDVTKQHLPLQVAIYNAQGVLQKETTITDGSIFLDDLPPGAYVIKLNHNGILLGFARWIKK